jgi:hypothetical protein
MIKTVKGIEKKAAKNGRTFAKISFDDCSANVFDTKIIEASETNIGKQVEVEFKEENGYKNITSLVPIGESVPQLQNRLPVAPASIDYPDSVKLNLDCLDKAIQITTVCLTVDNDGNPVKLNRKTLYQLAEDIRKWAKGETV